MPPPPRPSLSSANDTSKPREHKQKPFNMSRFRLAFSIWVKESGVSRVQYKSLLQVFSLAGDTHELRALPETLHSLKPDFKDQPLTIRTRTKELELNPSKLPSRTLLKETMEFVDPRDLFPLLLRRWLDASKTRPEYLKAIEDTADAEFSGLSGVDIITNCYAEIARSNTAVLAVSMSETDRLQMMQLIKRARKAFQLLAGAAAASYRQNSRASSTQPAQRPTGRRARSVSVESQSSFETDITHRSASVWSEIILLANTPVCLMPGSWPTFAGY